MRIRKNIISWLVNNRYDGLILPKVIHFVSIFLLNVELLPLFAGVGIEFEFSLCNSSTHG